MRLPNAAHETRPWRIREIAPDFTVEDVWALPAYGGAGDFPALPDAEPAGGQARWRQWTYQGHTGQPARLPWWLPVACLGSALVLLPWIAWLFVTLPQTELAAHWGLARAGLALALAIVLAASAVALLRRWPVAKVLVAIAAALLMRDAWFNVRPHRPAGACRGRARGSGRARTAARRAVPVGRRQLRPGGHGRQAVRARTAQTDRPRGRQTPASADSSPVTARTQVTAGHRVGRRRHRAPFCDLAPGSGPHQPGDGAGGFADLHVMAPGNIHGTWEHECWLIC